MKYENNPQGYQLSLIILLTVNIKAVMMTAFYLFNIWVYVKRHEVAERPGTGPDLPGVLQGTRTSSDTPDLTF